VFEYGTGRKNVATYRRVLDNSGRAQRIIGLGASTAEGTDLGAVTATDLAAVAAGAPLLEALIQPGVGSSAMRQALADEHLRLRKVPRLTIEFTPIRDDGKGRVPRYGSPAEVLAGEADYTLGDTVPFRAVEPATGSVRLNASLRVYGVEWATDEDPAVPTLTLVAD
jgi:hypothetical protein